MIAVTIAGVGLATAQGGRRELFAASPPVPPAPIPWPPGERAGCRVHRPARGLDPGADREGPPGRAGASGLRRPRRAHPRGRPARARVVQRRRGRLGPRGLANELRSDRGPGRHTVGGQRLPVCSAACASGLHALHPGHPAPRRGGPRGGGARARPAVGAQPREFRDPADPGLVRLLRRCHRGIPGATASCWERRRWPCACGRRPPRGPFSPWRWDTICRGATAWFVSCRGCPSRRRRWSWARGTGPAAVDAAELAAIASGVPGPVPVASAAPPLRAHPGRVGAALGGAGGAGLARAAAPGPRPFGRAGRRRPPADLGIGPLAGDAGGVPRARGGLRRGPRGGGPCVRRAGTPPWYEPSPPPPLRDRVLRRLVAEASARRPARPPELLDLDLPGSAAPPARRGVRRW